jgi:hypothetical protein
LHVGQALLPRGFGFGMEFFFVGHGVQMKSEKNVVAARLPRFSRDNGLLTTQWMESNEK